MPKGARHGGRGWDRGDQQIPLDREGVWGTVGVVKRMGVYLMVLAWLPWAAAVERVTVLGDSLTKEYQISFPGLPPLVDGLDPTNPAARNWSEILHERRNAHFDLGIFRNSFFLNRWTDLRVIGHEYNWAVPGATARAVRNLITGQNLDEITSDEDFELFLQIAPDWAQTSARLTTQVQTTSAAAVIWCGANDLRYGNTDPAAQVGGVQVTYNTIYNGDGTGVGNPQRLMDSIQSSVQAIAQHVRSARAGLPIVVCAVPHIGCAPAVQVSAPTDEVRTGRVTSALHALNTNLRNWTENTLGGVWVDTQELTESLIEGGDVVFGGVTFFNQSDEATGADPPAAHNRYIFSHDGFHPGTAMHALIAQHVQAALRAKAPGVFGASPVLTDRELIVTVLGIPANTGFVEFMAGSGAPANQRGPTDDPDGDSLVNLGEFSLADNTPFPGGRTVLPVPGVDLNTASVTLTWVPRFQSNIYVAITCQSSPDFVNWTDVPAARVTVAGDGSHTARVPVVGHPALYLRLKFTALP
ncbi:MAG: SGNH/GDSL hydrolase family protein [Verrucomicrobiales bacterium]